MKKYLLTAILTIVAVSQLSTLMARDNDNAKDWTLGGKVNIYSGWNGLMGVGAYVRYDVAKLFRLEPSLVILCEEEASLDLSVDLHMPLRISPELELYPLAGLSLNDPGKLGLGVNLGGGLGYKMSERLTADFGVKLMVAAQRYYTNPVIFSIGCGYKF